MLTDYLLHGSSTPIVSVALPIVTTIMIAIIGPILAAYFKVYLDGSKTAKKIKLVKDLTASIAQDQHPLLIETIFAATYKLNLDHAQIKILLEMQSPQRAIQNVLVGYRCLDYVEGKFNLRNDSGAKILKYGYEIIYKSTLIFFLTMSLILIIYIWFFFKNYQFNKIGVLILVGYCISVFWFIMMGRGSQFSNPIGRQNVLNAANPQENAKELVAMQNVQKHL